MKKIEKFKDLEEFIVEANIIHHGKYSYSHIGLLDSIKIYCDKHGQIFPTLEDHIFAKKGCSKCKFVSRNKSLWLDSLNIPNNKDSRNKSLKINGTKYIVDGYCAASNTLYFYLFDDWNANLNKYNTQDIHPSLKMTYGNIFEVTQNRIEYLKSLGFNIETVWESEFLASQKDRSKLIINDNKYCQFVTTDIRLFNKLKNYLSFKAVGVEYTAAYKSGWHGITYLLDNNGYFLLGLLNKVKIFLENNNCIYEIVDKRKSLTSNLEICLNDKLTKLNLNPRYYQTKIVETALNNTKGIVRACTGSGKTLTTALIAAKINKPTIIYVIGLDLLKQFHDLFSSLFDEPIGFIGNGVCDIHRINIASIWTISSALKISNPYNDDELNDKELAPNQIQKENIINMLQQTALHIFDESHVVTTDTIKQIFSKINPEYIYGFSGTPFRDDGSDLLINGILGEQIINVSASELIADGYLAQPIIKFVKVPKTFISSGTSNYQTVYKEYIVENEIRNNLIVKNSADLLTKNYQVLVLFKQLGHGKKLCEIFDSANIKYEYLSGSNSLDERIEVKNNLLSKKSNLVLASSIFDIGVDISSLSALVLAGGGKSSIRALQRIGRIIRKFPGKKHVAVVDFFDDVKFLKAHSKKRFQIYKSENGFKLLPFKGLD